MKKGLFLLLSMTLSYLSMAQVPNSFSYQMVIRNGNNELVANTTVGIRIGLLGGNAADTVWYEEEHKVKTNLNGLAYITIGKGNILKGAVSTIDWTKGPFFIKSETDPTGGTNYSLIIVSQMLSVPYAIYAKTAEKLSTPVTESDPLFSKSIAKGITAEDTARWSKKEVYDGNSGGGGITNESDPVFSNSVAKGIRSVDTAAWNNKLNLRDTLNMLRPYLRASDTASLSNRLNQKVDLQQLNTNTLTLDGKINIADTAGMLANYRMGINMKVNISDTLNMLKPYLKDTDTSSMLANYRTGINAKVNIIDTASMLQPYLRDADTTSMLLPYLRNADTILLDLENRFTSKVNITDTAAMLANYQTGINAKVNILDTAIMLQPYLRDADTTIMLSPYLMKADTTAMLANYFTGINAKVNILDTASMLQPYLRDADTTSMLSSYLRRADTTAMLANYRTGINSKVNILDTASMLQPYLRDADTTSMLSSYLRRADTTLMLTPYLRDADTTSMLMPYLRDADTTNMLIPYLLDADTSNMLSNYRAVLNTKAPINNPIFTGTVSGITQAMVGLPNVDNTSDVNKSISTATQTALNLKLNISDTAAMLLNYRNNDGGLPTSGNSLGDMLFWNGSAWVKLSAGSAGKVLKINGGIPEWANADFNCGLATTDVDINTYNTVQIGQQCWMKENLKTSRYRNGDLIPVVVYSAWGVLTTGGRDWYSGDSTTYEYPYGNLYNWYAVGDSRGLCPTGWHIPTDAEWTILTTNLGGESVAGGRLKSTSSIYWGSTNTNVDNLTGFSALPGGERSTGGTNVNNGSAASFWSATDNGSNAWFRYLRFSDGMMTRGSFGKTYGASVRCLKD